CHAATLVDPTLARARRFRRSSHALELDARHEVTGPAAHVPTEHLDEAHHGHVREALAVDVFGRDLVEPLAADTDHSDGREHLLVLTLAQPHALAHGEQLVAGAQRAPAEPARD